MLTLSVLSGEYAVCQLSPDQPIPAWVSAGELFSVTRTPEELSVVCAASSVPAGSRQAAGWSALKLHGAFDFALTGILAGVLNPLHTAGVGIFAFSTFDTDYVLVQAAQLKQAVSALRGAGYTVVEQTVHSSA